MSVWHPSCDGLMATADCPVCGAAAGRDCPPGPEGERVIHVDRVLLARGTAGFKAADEALQADSDAGQAGDLWPIVPWWWRR